MPSLSEFLFGSKDKIKKLPNFSPQQQQLFSTLLSQLQGLQGPSGGYNQALGLLQQYLDPQSDLYQNFEQPYLDEFNQQIVPQLSERFAGRGALSSSGFAQALGAAGGNLQTQLAQMKSGMQRQSIQDLLGQNNALTRMGIGAQPFSYLNKQGSSGFLPNFLGGLGSGYLGV